MSFNFTYTQPDINGNVYINASTGTIPSTLTIPTTDTIYNKFYNLL
jgi:hypothetical protein